MTVNMMQELFNSTQNYEVELNSTPSLPKYPLTYDRPTVTVGDIVIICMGLSYIFAVCVCIWGEKLYSMIIGYCKERDSKNVEGEDEEMVATTIV